MNILGIINALEAHIAFHCTNALCDQHVTCHLCALQIQKLAEHKDAMSTMSPLCSHFLPIFGQNSKCHQSVSARSPLKQQRITDNFFVHRKGLANISDLAPKSPHDQKQDMSPLCSKQSMYPLQGSFAPM